MRMWVGPIVGTVLVEEAHGGRRDERSPSGIAMAMRQPTAGLRLPGSPALPGISDTPRPRAT